MGLCLRGRIVPDSRTGKRFPLQLPIRLEGKGMTSPSLGETQNVSAAGAFLTLGADVEIGSNVDFEIVIPADAIGAAQDVMVRCKGRVVRSETGVDETNSEHQTGVACVIDSYEFIRSEEKPGT